MTTEDLELLQPRFGDPCIIRGAAKADAVCSRREFFVLDDVAARVDSRTEDTLVLMEISLTNISSGIHRYSE